MTETASETPAEPTPAAKAARARRRIPVWAFLVGVLSVGAVGGAAYLLWPEPTVPASVPVTEARVEDEVPAMPVPDGDAIRARVSAALAASPRDLDAPAEQAAAAAQAQTAPEAVDTQPTPAPAAQ
jgi:hypothetical protein